MLNSEVKNVCIVFKLKACQVFQRYSQSVDSEYVIVCDGEYQPLKVGEVMCRNVCSCKTVVLMVTHQHVPHHRASCHMLIDVNRFSTESSFHVLSLVVFRRWHHPMLRIITNYNHSSLLLTKRGNRLLWSYDIRKQLMNAIIVSLDELPITINKPVRIWLWSHFWRRSFTGWSRALLLPNSQEYLFVAWFRANQLVLNSRAHVIRSTHHESARIFSLPHRNAPSLLLLLFTISETCFRNFSVWVLGIHCLTIVITTVVVIIHLTLSEVVPNEGRIFSSTNLANDTSNRASFPIRVYYWAEVVLLGVLFEHPWLLQFMWIITRQVGVLFICLTPLLLSSQEGWSFSIVRELFLVTTSEPNSLIKIDWLRLAIIACWCGASTLFLSITNHCIWLLYRLLLVIKHLRWVLLPPWSVNTTTLIIQIWFRVSRIIQTRSSIQPRLTAKMVVEHKAFLSSYWDAIGYLTVCLLNLNRWIMLGLICTTSLRWGCALPFFLNEWIRTKKSRRHARVCKRLWLVVHQLLKVICWHVNAILLRFFFLILVLLSKGKIQWRVPLLTNIRILVHILFIIYIQQQYNISFTFYNFRIVLR